MTQVQDQHVDTDGLEESLGGFVADGVLDMEVDEDGTIVFFPTKVGMARMALARRNRSTPCPSTGALDLVTLADFVSEYHNQ